MNTRKRVTKFGLALSLGLLGVIGAASAQAPSTSIFDRSDVVVLSTNIDFVGATPASPATTIYTDVAYNLQACGLKQVRFRISALNRTTKVREELGLARINKVITNEAYIANTDALNGESRDTILELNNETAMAGYTLALLPPAPGGAGTYNESDSLRVTAESYVRMEVCPGCGVWGKDVVFDPTKERWAGCTYPGRDRDMIYCQPRKARPTVAGRKYWEAWIRDGRDCQYYKIVEMPDPATGGTRWWFAQSLRYQGTATLNWLNLDADADDISGSLNPTPLASTSRQMWGPGIGTGYTNSGAPATGMRSSLVAYGALYNWVTAINPDGNGTATTTTSNGAGYSTTRGICPEGWVLPNDKDWADLMNYQDVCPGGATTCHNSSVGQAVDSLVLGVFAGKNMKALASCSINAALCATDNMPFWQAASLNATDILGVDKFGFSALPSGERSEASSTFVGRGAYFAAWSATAGVSGQAHSKKISHNRGTVVHYTNTPAANGLAVRCVAQ